MELKDVFGEIESDGANLVHGRLLEWALTPPLWHAEAVGGRPHHQASPTRPMTLRAIRYRAVLRGWALRPKDAPFLGTRSESTATHLVRRDLLTPDEVMRLPSNCMILLR